LLNSIKDLVDKSKLPALIIWIMEALKFIKKLITMPFNILLTLFEIILNIISNLIKLNIPGAIKEIVNLLKFLVPGIGFIEKILESNIKDDFSNSLIDILKGYKDADMMSNKEKENFDNLLIEIEDKPEETINWFERVGLSGLLDSKPDNKEEYDIWLKNVGLEGLISKEQAKSINLSNNISQNKNETNNNENSNNRKKIKDLSLKELLDKFGPSVPDMLKQFFKIIRMIVTEAFPKFFLDIILGIFKWVICWIFKILPFLGSCNKDSGGFDLEKEILEKANIKLGTEDEIETDINLDERIKSWLVSVGLTDDLLKEINRIV
jgi:hypothetical protein